MSIDLPSGKSTLTLLLSILLEILESTLGSVVQLNYLRLSLSKKKGLFISRRCRWLISLEKKLVRYWPDSSER